MKTSKYSIALGVVACLLIVTVQGCSEAGARRKLEAIFRSFPNLVNEVRNGTIGGGQIAKTINVDQSNLKQLDDTQLDTLQNINSNNIATLKEYLNNLRN